MDPLAGSQWSASGTVAGFAKSAPNAVLSSHWGPARRRVRSCRLRAGSRRSLPRVQSAAAGGTLQRNDAGDLRSGLPPWGL